MKHSKEMVNQIRAVHRKLKQVEKRLEDKTVSVSLNGGMIKVIINGRKKILQIKIEKEAINPDKSELLEDLIIASVNKAIDSSKNLAELERKIATKGIIPHTHGLPPLF